MSAFQSTSMALKLLSGEFGGLAVIFGSFTAEQGMLLAVSSAFSLAMKESQGVKCDLSLASV